MATEPAGPVSVPATPFPEGKSSSGGGPGILGPASSHPVGVSLGYPSGLASPTEFDTRQMLPSPPDVDPLHTTKAGPH